MASNEYIANLGKKITIFLESGTSALKSENQLLQALGIQKDYFNRLKSGSRPLTDILLGKLASVTNIPVHRWRLDIEQFGRALGLSRREVAGIASITLPGIDFVSRIKDEQHISALFNILEGYWESYYYSVSLDSRLAVSRDVFVFRKINDDFFIECDLVDGHFKYAGYCFPVFNNIYIIMEKTDLINEIIVYCTNRPDRSPPALFGIILCLSGGVADSAVYPSSSRVAFRYLGKTSDEILLKVPSGVKDRFDRGEDIEAALKKELAGYVFPEECADPEVSAILSKIRNEVHPDQLPLALRMDE